MKLLGLGVGSLTPLGGRLWEALGRLWGLGGRAQRAGRRTGLQAGLQEGQQECRLVLVSPLLVEVVEACC